MKYVLKVAAFAWWPITLLGWVIFAPAFCVQSIINDALRIAEGSDRKPLVWFWAGTFVENFAGPFTLLAKHRERASDGLVGGEKNQTSKKGSDQ